MSAPTSSSFASYQEMGSYMVQKAAESIKTRQILQLFPCAIAALTGYQSLSHYKMALFGTDSWAHRKHLLSESYQDSSLSLKSRLLKAFQGIFGSIGIQGRAQEFLYGSAYLTASLGSLYALHALILSYSENLGKFESDLDESNKEIYPEFHQKEIQDKALDYLGKSRNTEQGQSYQLIDIYENQLLKSQVPTFSKEAEIAIKIADQAILPTSTPFTEKVVKPFYSLLHSITFGAYGEPSVPYTTETLSVEEITKAYEETKQLLIDQEPIDWQAKAHTASKNFCDWTWGFSPTAQESDCDNFVSLLGESKGSLLEKRLGILERLYHVLAQRAILQGRGECSPSLEAVCKDYCENKIGSSFSSLSSCYTTMQNYAQEFIQQVNLAKVHPLTQHETDTKKLDLLHSILQKIEPKANVKILREVASHFFGLSKFFTKKEFKDAFNNFIKQHHGDKASGELNKALAQISTQFNNIFGRGQHDELYPADQIQETVISTFLSPIKVVQDLYTWTLEWFKTPPQTLY